MRRSNKFRGVSYPLPALTAETAARSRELKKQDRLAGELVSPCSRESVEEKDGRAWPKIHQARSSLRRFFGLPKRREEGPTFLGGRAVHDGCRRYVLGQNCTRCTLVTAGSWPMMDDVAAHRGGFRPLMVVILRRLNWTHLGEAVPVDCRQNA